MPKVAVKYSDMCIYKLVHFDDLNDENIYVGHTTNMTKRKCGHKTSCCNPNDNHHNLKVYQFIRENGGWDKWDMILVEKYSCKCSAEAVARERYWIKELKATLNTREPGRTKKEWREANRDKLAEYQNEYREANREKLLEQKKEYHQANREKLNEKKKQKIICDLCGLEITRGHLKRHQRSSNCKK
jgi:hypothetical protein